MKLSSKDSFYVLITQIMAYLLAINEIKKLDRHLLVLKLSCRSLALVNP